MAKWVGAIQYAGVTATARIRDARFASLFIATAELPRLCASPSEAIAVSTHQAKVWERFIAPHPTRATARNGGPGFHPITRNARVLGYPGWRDERLPKGPRFASESLDADTASGSVFSN